MAGRQIRWQSAGRALGIAIAVVAGIISLPALLGSDRPPPVPADVGLAPPPAESVPVRVPPATRPAPPPSPKRAKGGPQRLAERKPRLLHTRPPRSHRRQRSRRSRHQEAPEAVAAPSTSTQTPPVYSYVPPAARPEFGFER